jgi:hypothetical protein
MNLYILTSGGQPLKHPIMESNLLAIAPNIDLENLPDGVCKFVRVPKPTPGHYQVVASTEPVYKIIDGVCYDVWEMREMTTEERQEKIRILEEGLPYPSWTLDIENYTYIPPVPFPDDYITVDPNLDVTQLGTVNYTWNEDTQSWERISDNVEP